MIWNLWFDLVDEDANKQDVRSSEGKGIIDVSLCGFGLCLCVHLFLYLFIIWSGDYCFVVVNPKDDDAESKSMLQVSSPSFKCAFIIFVQSFYIYTIYYLCCGIRLYNSNIDFAAKWSSMSSCYGM